MSENFKTITICCDFLMTRSQTQYYHLKWFSLIIKRALSRTVNVELKDFVSDLDISESFQRSTFFALSDQVLPLEETHAHFNTNAISNESLIYLEKYLKDTFVIGYELSEQTKKILDLIKVKYVDIWLHPIRFLDDNFYAYYSSDNAVQQKLKKYDLPEDTYYLYADKLKIQSYMGWDKFHNAIDKLLVDNSCLFVGQTLTDKAVCRDGTMLTVLNFEEEFSRLTKQYDHVYFSPHPMIKGDYSSQTEFLKQFNNVSIIKEPGYKLLCSDKIKKVVAISSSLVYEAKFFNKETEFFYRPIVPISSNHGDDGKYISIFNKLHSSLFWADVLEDEFNVNKNIIDIDYMTTKNNYRDMLSLYYNNKVFDKEQYIFERTEQARKNALPKKLVDKKPKQIHAYYSNVIAIEKIREMMLKNKVVSFDIFDTVVQRRIANPGDIPLMVAQYAQRKFNIPVEAYIDARRKCKELSSFSFETPLLDRYKIIGNLLGLSETVAMELYNLELELDLNLLEPRLVGTELIAAARAAKKKVILTSDIYYDRAFIVKILEKCGIYYDELFISSELDRTKESGKLYDCLIEKHGNNILHVGDNRHSDFVKASEKKITPALLLSNKEQIKRTLKNYKELDGEHKEIRNGLIQGNISRFPIITSEPGYTSGKPDNFGYNVVGDIFLAFAHWILKEAQKRNVKRLAFLARDGEIVKKVFDKINTSDIETVYILASRRCVRVSSMISKNDVINEIENFVSSLNEKNNEIINFLSLRFGISRDLVLQILGPEFKYHYNERNNLKEKLLSDDFITPVLENASKERENYLQYLRDNKIDSTTAFVDIGHNGSLQASISKLLNLDKSLGLYFATYEGVVDTLGSLKGEHVGLGYYRDKISTKDRADNYIKYALMIETLFLNDKGTFIKFERVEEQLKPVYLSVKQEGKRIAFINSMQIGIMNYVSDVVSTLKSLKVDICESETYSKSFDPCARFFEIMKHPMLRDAKMFSGVTMENFFSGRDIRYITPDPNKLNAICLWAEGTKLLKASLNSKAPAIKIAHPQKTKDAVPLKNSMFKRTLAKTTLRVTENVFFIMAPFMNKKKLNKLRMDRERFYKDSKNKIIKNIWKASLE